MLRHFNNKKYWGSSSAPPHSQKNYFFFFEKRQGYVSKAACEVQCSTPRGLLLQQHGRTARGNPGLQGESDLTQCLCWWEAKGEWDLTALQWAGRFLLS